MFFFSLFYVKSIGNTFMVWYNSRNITQKHVHTVGSYHGTGPYEQGEYVKKYDLYL